MSLMTYEEVRPWARSIRNRVASREMPPWHLDRRIGIQRFKNDPSLTDAEIAAIVDWVDAGAPRGDLADMPPLPTWGSADDWQIGEPDLIVRYPSYLVPAAGPDLFGYLYADFDLEEDRYIRAIQTKPADKRARLVVHHTNAFAIAPGDTTEGVESEAPTWVEYASGKQAEIYPEGLGRGCLQAGSRTRLSYHLHSVGEDVDTVVELGIVFHPEGTVPDHVRWTKQLAGAHGTIAGLVDLPPGQVTRSGRLHALQQGGAHHHVPAAHAHARQVPVPGADLPDAAGAHRGGPNCAHFDYNWHLAYNYDDDAAPLVPAGTILHVINWHDNTAGHRANPDPRNWTGSGGRTIDEMGFAWIGWYDLTDEEYEAELAGREARRKTN